MVDEIHSLKRSVSHIKDMERDYAYIPGSKKRTIHKTREIINAGLEQLPKRLKKKYDNLDYFNSYVSWVKMHSAKDLREISDLENMLIVLKTEIATVFKKRVEKGSEMSKLDLKKFEVVIDLLAKLYKLKYGEKHISVTADMAEIQKIMNPDIVDVTPEKQEEDDKNL